MLRGGGGGGCQHRTLKLGGGGGGGVGCVNIELVGGGGGGRVGCEHFRLDRGGGTPPPAYVSISMKMTISVDKNYIKLKEICSN